VTAPPEPSPEPATTAPPQQPPAQSGSTAPPQARTRVRATRWVPLAVLCLILVVALAVGMSGHSSGTSVDDRVHRITAQIRCPVCSGETVADSAAPISQDIRTAVRQQLQAGRSDHDVYAYIVHQYPGTSLTPPASGVGLVVWALPIAVFAAAVAGLAFTFARWRGRAGVAVSDEDRRLVEKARHDADD
jgi:cytochrome c-type biogenesis protein CcmH